MKKFLNTFFYYWWKPAIVVAIGFFIFAIGGFTYSRFWEAVCSWIFGLTLLLLLISFIFQLVRKEKEEALYTAFFFFGVLIALFFYGLVLSFTETFVTGDHYADNLKIPDNIEIFEPVQLDWQTEERPDSILSIKRSNPDFQVYKSFQPGLYEYDVWLGYIESGTVHLKVYEVTQNDALSTNRLPETSSIDVDNPTDSIIRFSTVDHFTIYEGDWGKPYAARFEVWFTPLNGGEIKKLFTKNYKIEG